jgi:hypothetical protein
MRIGRFAGVSILALLMVACLSIQPAAAQKRFYVCYINSVQKEVLQGKTVTVIFGVFYNSSYYAPCGEPVVLKPKTGQAFPTGSFKVVGSSPVLYTDLVVTPTGKPGEYRTELNWPTDAPVGKEVVFVVESSLYDGTTGPTYSSSYVETPDPIDDSTFLSVRLVQPVVGFFDFIPGGLPTFLALLIFLILLGVLLLLIARRRRKT